MTTRIVAAAASAAKISKATTSTLMPRWSAAALCRIAELARICTPAPAIAVASDVNAGTSEAP